MHRFKQETERKQGLFLTRSADLKIQKKTTVKMQEWLPV